MAIDQGTETLALKKEERTWRINIETPKGADAIVTVLREVVCTAADGSIFSRYLVPGNVTRSLSETAGQTFTVKDKTYTTAEIAGVIAFIADKWRQDDIAAEALRIDESRDN